MSQRLGDLLVKEKVITPEQLDQATKLQKESHSRLASALVKLGFLSDEDVTNFLSRQYGVPAINLSYFEIDPAVVKLIPYETAKRYQILPLSRVGASLTIAMVDPTNVFAMDDIKFMTGFNIEPVVASESSIIAGIDKAYGTSKEEELEQVMQSMNDLGEGTDIELQNEEQELELKELEKAAQEVHDHFYQCNRCGKWVCREVCWNNDRGLCVECAPKLGEEMAYMQAQAQRSQLEEKIQAQDLTQGVNYTDQATGLCPSCHQESGGGKFCQHCGAAMAAAPAATKRFCGNCGSELVGGVKFCGECGTAAP